MQEDSDPNLDLVKNRKSELDKVSGTMCLAKWLQSTVLLYNGQTHSCHHPDRHKIMPEDLINNAQGIHNTPVKMKAREELLQGKQTKECDYCWNIENMELDHISDRIYKSTYGWSFPRFSEVMDSGNGKDIVPSYLEVAFDSTCNCKCLYCNPESSSSWEKEIKEFGAVPQDQNGLYDLGYIKSKGALPISSGEKNPYIDAFWSWWPELHKKLKILRVTGGEPLLSANTWKLIDLLIQEPRRDLHFSINTNLCLPRSHVERLVEKINKLQPHIGSFEVYTSLESIGKQAEYVRYGMDFDHFISNCKFLLDNTPQSMRLHFMTTINLLSAPTFLSFLNRICELRSQYKISSHNFRVRTFFNYLRWPECFSLKLLSKQDKETYGKQWIDFVENRKIQKNLAPHQYFYEFEVEQIRRLVDYMKSYNPKPNDFMNFRLFIDAMDKRRNQNFKATFPEFSHYMDPDFTGESAN